MYWFKKMIDVVREKGIINGMSGSGEPDFQRPVETSGFWKYVEAAEVFVFTPKNKSPEFCDHEELYPEIDPPFEVMSIEMLGDRPITSIHEDDKKDGIFEASVYCILNFEIQDHGKLYYGQFLLTKTNNEWLVFSTNAMRQVVKTMLDRISVESDGLERIRAKVKIGTGKSKKHHRISKIIHIMPKSRRARIEDATVTREIDFSHRFVRRGHWRDLPGRLGKNRAGDYCVSGKTWVNDSKPIGPEDKPLIKKTRLVKNG